jgi:hypothetical protein
MKVRYRLQIRMPCRNRHWRSRPTAFGIRAGNVDDRYDGAKLPHLSTSMYDGSGPAAVVEALVG